MYKKSFISVDDYGFSCFGKYNYKQYISVIACYWVGDNQVSPVTTNTGNVFTARPYNSLNNRTYSLVPYVSFDPTAWWTCHFNAVLLYIRNKGSANGITIDQRTNVHEIETSNELHLGKTWSAELDGFFPSKQSFGQTSSTAASYNISGGLQKTILQGNGSLHLTVNDLFNTVTGQSQTTGMNGVAAFYQRRGR
ncbi:MAG: outer membrane beta-barrel protein [Bacteroidota bacterium]